MAKIFCLSLGIVIGLTSATAARAVGITLDGNLPRALIASMLLTSRFDPATQRQQAYEMADKILQGK